MPVRSFAPARVGRFAGGFSLALFAAVILSGSFKGRLLMSSVYFGGSRSLQAPSPAIAQAVQAVLQAGQSLHVGCCVGADALVISSALFLRATSSLVVFAISPPGAQVSPLSSALPAAAQSLGSVVHWQAGGGASVPLRARFLRRSLAAAQGCSAAVFFSPGKGSLAVAARLVGSMPVFAFGSQPSPIPHQAGQWTAGRFMSLACWQWQSAQLQAFTA